MFECEIEIQSTFYVPASKLLINFQGTIYTDTFTVIDVQIH